MSGKATLAVVVAVVAVVGVVGPAAAGSVAGSSPATATGVQQAGNETGNATGGAATVTVSATGTAEAQPDQAVVRVSAIAVADDSATAARRLARNVTRLRDALLAANLSADQVRTVRFDLFRREPRRERGAPGPNRTVFVARQTLEIRLNDTDRAGEIVDVAVGSGAATVEDVAFTLSEATRRELQRRALREAVTDARGQAEAIAAASGLELVGVRSVSTDARGPRVARELALTADAGGAETTIDSGPVTVTASVTVTYDATD